MKNGQLSFKRYPAASRFLEELEPSLKAMLTHIDEYIKTYHRPEEGKPELPYFINERPNVGLLAGGVWRSHPSNLVLEEYRAPKRNDKGKFPGRFDLWCRVHNITTDKQCSIYLEAKQTWKSIAKPPSSVRKITRHLLQEYRDAFANAEEDLKSGSLHYVCGTVFSVPELPKCLPTKADALLNAYDSHVDTEIMAFAIKHELSILRVRYYWHDMIADTATYRDEGGKSDLRSHPLLDVYFATKEKQL